MTEGREYSKFRDFLIPDAQNTLQSASFRHSRGDYDGANELLEETKLKIAYCQRQLQEEQQHLAKEDDNCDD
jgi:hypothetical protein